MYRRRFFNLQQLYQEKVNQLNRLQSRRIGGRPNLELSNEINRLILDTNRCNQLLKSIESTLNVIEPPAIVDIGEKEISSQLGLAYVAFSRVTTLNSLALIKIYDFETRFNAISRSNLLRLRKIEEARLRSISL